ncbi:MAG: response regulator transcription factor [Treponema sp.]|nr:response regulator transcription factor [Treponema sp.]
MALILLVEDNEQIQRGNERMLKRRGYAVTSALTLAEARRRIAEQTPDAIVLDIMLPDGNGLDFMRELRTRKLPTESSVPILLLTGLTTPEDVVRGLSSGGDDYLAKPYDFNVLAARIEALLRRTGRVPETLTKGALQLDIIANRAYLGGNDLLLSPKEFALLLLMAQNEGRLLSAEYLSEAIWKQPPTADTSTVRTAVSRLRTKLGDGKADAFIIENEKQEGGYIFRHIAE